MTLLADWEIEQALADGDITIEPRPTRDRIQPASVDITLSNEFRLFRRGTRIDSKLPSDDVTYTEITLPGDPFWLRPAQFVLASTVEEVGLSGEIAARIEGKSSIARMGVVVHSTAGFVDPGFLGQLTLEMTNFNGIPVALYPGMKIAQLSFTRIARTKRAYGDEGLGSKYQGQSGPTPTRVNRAFNTP